MATLGNGIHAIAPYAFRDPTDNGHHGKPRLLHLFRSQLPVARTCTVSFAAAACAGLAAVGALSERSLLPSPGRARFAEPDPAAAGGFRSCRSGGRGDAADPQPDRILLHLFAGLDAVMC